MPQFGSKPGVQIDTTSGDFSGVSVGREQWLVLIGNGDNAAGSADPNTVHKIDSRSNAENLFGADTDIVAAYQRANTGGANRDYIKAIMTDNQTTTESFTTTSSGTLAEGQIIPDSSRITVDDTTNNETEDVEFVFEDPANVTMDAGTMYINPYTGAWGIDSSSDYDITYDYADYASAISTLPESIKSGEFGVVFPLTSNESVISDVSNEIAVSNNGIREHYKMFLGAFPIQYNATSSDGEPRVDSSSYTHSYDEQTAFIVGPTAIDDASPSDPLYPIGNAPYFVGEMTGSAIDNPVFNNRVPDADDMAQELGPTDVQNLRDEFVMPIRVMGDPRFKGNKSTYDTPDDEYPRDWYTMRIHDVVAASVQEIGQETLGLIQNRDTRQEFAGKISNFFEDLVEVGVLEPGGQEVDVYEVDRETIGVDMGVTPHGVAKSIDVNITIKP